MYLGDRRLSEFWNQKSHSDWLNQEKKYWNLIKKNNFEIEE